MATARNPGTLIGGAGSDTHLKLSFEFFPPKTDEMEKQLWQAVKRLEPLRPALRLGDLRRRRLDARAHACDGAAHPQRDDAGAGGAPDLRRRRSRDEVDEVARQYWDAGIRHIVALRGDMPAGAGRYAPHPGGYARAADLVAGLKRIARFRDQRRGLSRDASRRRHARRRSRQPQAQGRCRRHARDHAVFLRRRQVPALPRPVRTPSRSACRSFPASCR